MKKIISICIILFISFSLLSTPIDSTEIKKEYNILFVGNSLTYSGGMPLQLQNICAMYDINIQFTAFTEGWARLADRKEAIISKMRETEYDFVVLQEYDGKLTDVAKELCDEVKSTGAKPVLYLPPLNPNYNSKWEREYLAYVEENDVIFVNACNACAYTYQKLGNISLFYEGDFHLNLAGAYLTACVFASTMFNLHVKDICEDNNIYTYAEPLAMELGQAAWEFVWHYNEYGTYPRDIVEWPTSTPKPTPDVMERIKGDVNGDGIVTLSDAQITLRAALNIVTLSEKETWAADDNNDGKITLNNAQTILRAALNITTISTFT